MKFLLKERKILLILLILFIFEPAILSAGESKNPVDAISLHFLKKYLNAQLKGKYFVAYISKTKTGVNGIIQSNSNRIAFPFFINFIKPGDRKDEDYPYKFKGLPANKLKDGTIIVKIKDFLEIGVKKPINGYGNPINVLKMLNVSEAIEKASK